MNKYKIVISGSGFESSWLSLTKKQYNYWKFKAPQALKYAQSSPSTFNHDNVDKSLLFLLSEDDIHYDFFDSPKNKLNQFGASPEDSSVSIFSVDEDDNIINIIYEDIPFNDFVEGFSDDNSDSNLIEKEFAESDCNYFCEILKTYKGTFFVGYFYDDEFDADKLKIKILSNFNEIDCVDSIFYGSDDIDNFGDFIDLKSEKINFIHL